MTPLLAKPSPPAIAALSLSHGTNDESKQQAVMKVIDDPTAHDHDDEVVQLATKWLHPSHQATTAQQFVYLISTPGIHYRNAYQLEIVDAKTALQHRRYFTMSIHGVATIVAGKGASADVVPLDQWLWERKNFLKACSTHLFVRNYQVLRTFRAWSMKTRHFRIKRNKERLKQLLLCHSSGGRIALHKALELRNSILQLEFIWLPSNSCLTLHQFIRGQLARQQGIATQLQQVVDDMSQTMLKCLKVRYPRNYTRIEADCHVCNT